MYSSGMLNRVGNENEIFQVRKINQSHPSVLVQSQSSVFELGSV